MPETKNIKQELQALKEVQVLDKQIYDLTQELLLIPVERQDVQGEFEKSKAQVESLDSAMKQLKLKQKEKEMDLAEREEKIVKLQVQLTQIKTNKEYSVLQQEIASGKADNSILEEEIIRLMDEVDLAVRNLNGGREVMKQDEKKLHDKKAELDQKEKTCRGRIDELKARKFELIRQVHPEVSALYEKILAKKSGVALAPINGENCSACHMLLRPQILNEVMLRENLVLCESCSRILYLD